MEQNPREGFKMGTVEGSRNGKRVEGLEASVLEPFAWNCKAWILPFQHTLYQLHFLFLYNAEKQNHFFSHYICMIFCQIC